MKQLVVPPRAGEAAPPIHFDGSVWLLVAVNALSLGVAQWQRWPLSQLMLIYWAQSVAIGVSYVLRIVSLALVGIKRQPARLDGWFLLCAAAFVANHLWSYRYNREMDRQGTPNIGTLMFTPYLRIVPMHLTILGGELLGKGALLLFGGLKTLADIAMHLVEHAQLQKSEAKAEPAKSE